jgi:hypothetical protein
MRAPVRHGLYRALSTALGWARSGEPAAGLRVLLYHSVGTRLPHDPHGIGIDRDSFIRHLSYLDAHRDLWGPAPFALPEAGPARVAISFDDGFKDVLTVAAPLLVERRLPFILFVTTDFLGSDPRLYLEPPELKELSRLPGATVGSHGVSHRRLASLPDAALREELSRSKKYLEDLLGTPVPAISYPNGSVDRRVRDAAQEAGYTLGGTSRYGVNMPKRDPLLLCRTELTAWDSVDDLRLKLEGHWDWYRLRHRDPASDSGSQYC